MSRNAPARRARLLITLVVSLVAFAAMATSAGAVITSVETFKTSIDVKLDLDETSNWQGIQAGCYAPQEEFDMEYGLSIDSTPHKNSKLKSGVASLTGASFGVTPNYGDKGSFTQTGRPGQWTLQTQYPTGCGGEPAPPVPAWAASPTCKKVSERVEATLLMNDLNDPDADLGSLTDGTLMLIRTPKAKPTVFGRSIGAGCHRTLQDIYPKGLASLVEISLKSTIISVPVPRLQSKLKKISNGSDRSKPSFSIPIRISGSCDAMEMSPTVGPRPEFTDSPISFPHKALGSVNGDASKTTCYVHGKGKAIVRRVGPVVSTGKLVP